MKIAVFLPNWVGDAVMATAALRAVRDRFADAEIVAVVRPPVDTVLDGTTLVDRVIVHRPKAKSPADRGWRFLRQLRAERFDQAILFPNSLHSAAVAYFGGCRRRIGINRDGRGLLLSQRLPRNPDRSPAPVMLEYERIVEALGCPVTSRRLELAVTEADQAALDAFWAKQPPAVSRQSLVSVNTGGAFGSAKNWPVERFASLARRLAADDGHTVLILCGPAERDQARLIAEMAGHERVVSLADEPLSIGLTKAAIRSSSLLVTTDSGPRHFAAAFDVPVVTIFGPTHIAWSENFHPASEHVQLAVDCGPCQQRECPLGHHRCMRDLSVDAVHRSIQSLRERTERRAA